MEIPFWIAEVDERSEPDGLRQRRGLLRYPFHQITVGDDGINPVIKKGEALPVETGCHVPCSDGHSDTIAKSLAQWTRRRLDAPIRIILGMTCCLAAPLTELFEILH